MSITREIAEYLQKGKAKDVRRLVQQALEDGVPPQTILDDGLLAGLMVIGEKFQRDEVFVPEVLMASRAMNVGLTILEDQLHSGGEQPLGRVVLGTVHGDWHDIGKHLVAMMLRSVGFEVTDIGYDADADMFIDTAEEIHADIICMSALLTTTMPAMQEVIREMEGRGVRGKYIVMIGGAPVNRIFAQEITADIYTPDAVTCAQAARKAVLAKRGNHEISEPVGEDARGKDTEKTGLPAGFDTL